MSETEVGFHFSVSLLARPDESVRRPDNVILAGTGSEIVQVSESKDMFLSFERRPRPPWRESNTGILSKERMVDIAVKVGGSMMFLLRAFPALPLTQQGL